MNKPLGFAIVGCGFIADHYRFCYSRHQDALRLLGIFDRDPARQSSFQQFWGDRAFPSFEAVLADPDVNIIVNLTPPESHAEISRRAIEAGKHVYSEKPLALNVGEAMALRDEARRAGVRLSSAPCNMLGESTQTLWAAIRSGRIGKPRLVYAEIDDGMIHRTDFASWLSRSGRPWPARSEFETGCTFEHAGYVITVLGAMFGPVRRVTAFAATIFADKGLTPAMEHMAPDFSVGLLEFDGGIVARLTNSVVASRDHRLRIFGDEGHLEMPELWDYASPVIFRSLAKGRAARWLERRGLLPGHRLPHVRPMPYRARRGDPTMDFMRGVVELARAVESGSPCRLDEDFAVHVTEVTEILQHPDRFERPAKVKSTFAPIAPMEWAMPAPHASK